MELCGKNELKVEKIKVEDFHLYGDVFQTYFSDFPPENTLHFGYKEFTSRHMKIEGET
jgi:hypothetical protein